MDDSLRITVIFLVVVSILWIPILLTSAGGQLFIYLQAIQSALGPPIFGVYVFGIMLPRVNEKVSFRPIGPHVGYHFPLTVSYAVTLLYSLPSLYESDH